MSVDKISRWEKMEKEISEQAKHAKEYWGYECLENGKLKWDIGKEVYFANGGRVWKGIVCSVNPSNMCGVKLVAHTGRDEGSITYTHSTELYTNVYYALTQAEYQQKQDSTEMPRP